MPHSPQKSRARCSVRLAAGAVAALMCFSAAQSASADQRTSSPTAEAQRAGVEVGNAYMGWKGSASPSRQISSAAAVTGVTGIDVASWQKTVNWKSWKKAGKSFAYVKATEGTSYRNPYFRSQYDGSFQVGMIRGAYHFAAPGSSSGYAQANYFVRYGGAWTKDGKTLPGVLDIEYNPYGATCYGLSKKKMVAWVTSFTSRYKALTGRDAVIYTNLDWWKRCTGNSKKFSRTNPLWVARYSSKVGTLPGGWPFYTFWQYGTKPLDQDKFNGKRDRLLVLAKG